VRNESRKPEARRLPWTMEKAPEASAEQERAPMPSEMEMRFFAATLLPKSSE
jgi:hypothetical protein